MSEFTVLPLLIVRDKQGTPSIRCRCGAEASTLRKGTGSKLRGMRAAPPMPNLAPDVTDLGLLNMILHATACKRGNELMEAGRAAMAGSAVPQ